MNQPPMQQPTVAQPKQRGYLDELAAEAARYFPKHHEDVEVLELKKGETTPATEADFVKYLEDKPRIQQKVADLVNYSPSRWLLSQELPEVRKRRGIFGSEKRSDPTDDPYEWARLSNLQGICFSGGGIRSATFNLGVLQGLAKLGILSHFDYLSSVSGGGYIHEWFAAWVKRAEGEEAKRAKRPKRLNDYKLGDGFREVEKQLVPLPSTKDYPSHPEPIRWLRRYSNYLTPQKGLFTADTWVAVAIWLRNTFLNQLVLVSGLFFVLLFPYWIAKLITYAPTCLILATTVAAVALFLVAVFNIARELRREYSRIRFMDKNQKDEQEPEEPRKLGGETTIQTLVVLPLLLASVLHLHILISPVNQSNSVIVLEYAGIFLLLFVLIAATAWAGACIDAYEELHGLERLRDFFKTKWRETLKLEWPGFFEIDWRAASNWSAVLKIGWSARLQVLRVGVSGIGGLIITTASLSALAGTLLYVGVRWRLLGWVPPWCIPTPPLGISKAALFQIAFGPPLLLSVPFFSIVIGAGLVGRDFPDWLREWLARVRAWSLLFGFGWMLFFGIALLGPSLVHWQLGEYVRLTKTIKASAVILWLFTTGGSVLAGNSNKTSGKPSEGAPRSVSLNMLAKVGAYVFILGLLLVLSVAANCSLCSIANMHSFCMWALLILGPPAIFGLFGWRADVNDFSLNPFYRNRLTRCYLGASNQHRNPNPLTGFDDRDTRGMQISRLTPDADPKHMYTGPFPIFCTAINLSFGEDLAWQERKAASFAFTPVCSGYQVGWTAGKAGKPLNFCGFARTAEYAFPDGGINMATAVAISGAAASPNWGYHTDPATAFLMTMFNVRLGWWLINPRRPEKKDWASPRFAPWELTKELFGRVNDAAKFVYLSDGGHFDNMGLYELVRRRCYRIVICDAEQDENYFFEGIGNAIRKCRIDFGAEITLDLSKLRLVESTGNCESHWALGSIRYPETPENKNNEDPDPYAGKVLYIKSSLTGALKYALTEKESIDLAAEPIDVINYKFTHQHFPHDTTANQWFTESQFESYRRLGYHVIDEVERCKKWEGF